MTPYFDEQVPAGPDALSFTSVYRRMPRRLVGHVVVMAYPEDHGRRTHGHLESSEFGKVAGATWTCACGRESRDMWGRATYARKALIDHWRRMHSAAAVLRLFGVRDVSEGNTPGLIVP
jgi:hypothetical protein